MADILPLPTATMKIYQQFSALVREKFAVQTSKSFLLPDYVVSEKGGLLMGYEI